LALFCLHLFEIPYGELGQLRLDRSLPTETSGYHRKKWFATGPFGAIPEDAVLSGLADISEAVCD
jgi:hypothetical protein